MTQSSSNSLIRALASSTPEQISWSRIPSSVLSDGKRFFIDKEVQKNGEWPMAIHNNYIIGADKKKQRFQNVSLWLIQEEPSSIQKYECKGFRTYLPPPPSSHSMSKYVFKILTFDRPEALTRLLQSLLEADYLGRKDIDLEIFVDLPEGENPELAQITPNREKCIKIAEKLKWPFGKKKVIVREQHFGLAGQWLNSWFPLSDTELSLVLEDDNLVSPHFFIWLDKAVATYYRNVTNYDPRMFGIAMQNQHMILGKYPATPGSLLDAKTMYYKYQQISTWGPLIFPNFWADFISWYWDKSSNSDFLPLFSNLITNKWFISRGGGRSVWSAWFIRYCGEKGLYTLYTNFPGGEAFVVNSREKGVNYPEKKGLNSAMVKSMQDKLDFPPSKTIPIYDFHFNLIEEDPLILEGRALYSDIFNVEIY